MVSRISVLKTETADKSLYSLHFYDSRNLSGTLNTGNKASHDIYLNYNSKHTRRKSKEEVITEPQEKLFNFEETVEQNVI